MRGRGRGLVCARARHCRPDNIPRKFSGVPCRKANSGVPDFNAQCLPVSPAAQQDFAGPGVFQGVRDEVADHLFEQTRIAANRNVARDHPQGKIMRLRLIGELILQTNEQIVERKVDLFDLDSSGLDLVDVE